MGRAIPGDRSSGAAEDGPLQLRKQAGAPQGTALLEVGMSHASREIGLAAKSATDVRGTYRVGRKGCAPEDRSLAIHTFVQGWQNRGRGGGKTSGDGHALPAIPEHAWRRKPRCSTIGANPRSRRNVLSLSEFSV